MCRNAERLLECGIKLLAIDFDQTLVSTHTGGVWQKTAEILATRVRPCIKRLVQTAVANGISVAIVTFSPQVKLISEVLALTFPKDSHQASDPRAPLNRWPYEGDGTGEGKQPHMASVAEELAYFRSTYISRKSTLLIDDDMRNIDLALRHGVNAVLCSPQDPTSVERGIDALLSSTGVP
ncbi:hypothetical protein CTAYLR_007281 [Chrysophaeum taylorii]|uniref:Uncharacterized protein n=1 Tax=Chrysophaeum taylorii TaxID=2483200 RepID=A0AAD7UII2_9STRA|nr:hypothetical protein CTAYLR_007281 [Chrysophaeum taylorii]